MRFAYSETCLAHDTGERHPETADRLLAIRRELTRRHGVDFVEPDPAAVGDIEAVHDPAYIDRFRSFCLDGGGSWDPDTVAVEETWAAAKQCAGMAKWAALTALDGLTDRNTPFALGRPPGHHALSDEAMGFCFINNVAVAAQAAIDAGADRVAIIDWDVHHGNGTQEIFERRADVFYASVHERGLYPGTGAIEEIGDGPGERTILNAPLPAGSGDVAYQYVFEHAVVPAIERFDPALVLVSAGFDAHRYDPISRMRMSTDGFARLTDLVRSIGEETPIAFVLEGGYGLDTLAEGVGVVHESFDGLEVDSPTGEPTDEVRELVDRLRAGHQLDE